MQIYLEEKIGNPDLFTGRKKELSQLLAWVEGIKRDIQVDLFARAKAGDYSLIGEIKNRTKTKFSLVEARRFLEKAQELMALEGVTRAVLVVFSLAGFHQNTLEFFRTNNIAWSDDARWLDNQGL